MEQVNTQLSPAAKKGKLRERSARYSKKYYDSNKNNPAWRAHRNELRRDKYAENKAAGRQIRMIAETRLTLPEPPSAASVLDFTKDLATMAANKRANFDSKRGEFDSKLFRFAENMVGKCLGNNEEMQESSQADEGDDVSLLSEGEVVEESKPPAKRAHPVSLNDQPIPKTRRVEVGVPNPAALVAYQKGCLHAALKANPSLIQGKPINLYNLSTVRFGRHAQHRLRVRGILEEQFALQLMEKGEIIEQESSKYDGQFMVSYHDDCGVQHLFPLTCHCDGSVLVKTYLTISPFKGYRRRMMLNSLEWLSDLLDVPFPLISEYFARAIGDFPHGMIYHPDLGPEVMEVVKSILPTKEEVTFFPMSSLPVKWVNPKCGLWRLGT